MRVPFVLGSVGVAIAVSFAACIPNPESDYQDYLERTSGFAQPVIDAGPVDTGPPPTTAVDGLYYGACLPELAFGDPQKVFNFYTTTKYTPDPSGTGGTISFTIQPLKLSATRTPPATVSTSGASGPPISSPTPAAVNAMSQFTLTLGTVNVPGDANPLSGSAVNIDSAGLKGAYAASGPFCTLLTGNVTAPVTLMLTPEKNICRFIPIKEGDATPTFMPADFAQGSCPAALF